MKLPENIAEYLRRLCVEYRYPAAVRVAADGRLLECGGNCERYGLPESAPDDASRHPAFDFLEGVLPLGGKPIVLPLVCLREGLYVEVHGVPSDGGDWIVLLDASFEARQQSRMQQALNDMALLRDRREKLLQQVRKDHEDLLAILDRLNLITAVINARGQVEFVNRRGEELLLRSRGDVQGQPWERVFPLSPEHRAALDDALRQAPDRPPHTHVQMDVAGGRHYWMEVDVQDDPRAPGQRILYLYDVSDVYDLRALLNEKASFEGIVGRSRPMEEVFGLIRDLAGMDATVLIEGETGTGKELVARAIHYTSRRRDKPFIVVNCAGLSDSLINSELFGHRRGAFTGAIQDQEGLFEAAHDGTIVLDEIGDIPMNTQTRILRVLEEREVVRIGETKPRKIDIRILAATNKDLVEEVRKGRFREDLLYRIRVARVALPPLRKRREDIPLLVDTFLRKSRASTGKAVEGVDSETMRALLNYPWPGNVRELRNAIEFAMIGCKGGVILPADLPPEIRETPARAEPERPYDTATEKDRIRQAIQEAGGNRGKAADRLGISRATLYRRLKACG